MRVGIAEYEHEAFVPFTYYWSEHFSTWVIRDADNHLVGQVESEERARLIVTACNSFMEKNNNPELREAFCLCGDRVLEYDPAISANLLAAALDAALAAHDCPRFYEGERK